jgi:hypothetical protein
MTHRQFVKATEQLRTGLEVFMLNSTPDADRSLVKVECYGFTPDHALYFVSAPASTKWDAQLFVKEVEKVLPNLRVTQVLVRFYSRSIVVYAKELGRRGSYDFEIVWRKD